MLDAGFHPRLGHAPTITGRRRLVAPRWTLVAAIAGAEPDVRPFELRVGSAGTTMSVMVPILNAVLYVVALGLSLAVLTPLPERSSRRVRIARAALAGGGGAAMASAVALSFLGHWFASGIAGCVAIVIVSLCLGIALSARTAPRADDDDDSGGGGGGPRKRPDPPAPPEPAGGPAAEIWTQFDRARAGWEREREALPG
jgi:hypothetical protein